MRLHEYNVHANSSRVPSCQAPTNQKPKLLVQESIWFVDEQKYFRSCPRADCSGAAIPVLQFCRSGCASWHCPLAVSSVSHECVWAVSDERTAFLSIAAVVTSLERGTSPADRSCYHLVLAETSSVAKTHTESRGGSRSESRRVLVEVRWLLHAATYHLLRFNWALGRVTRTFYDGRPASGKRENEAIQRKSEGQADAQMDWYTAKHS